MGAHAMVVATCINYCDVNDGGTTKQVGCIQKSFDRSWQNEGCHYEVGGCYCDINRKTYWKRVWPPPTPLK
jgi:hypothetical protein